MPTPTRSMVQEPAGSVNLTLGQLEPLFVRHLEAENKSPGTVSTYLKALRALDAYLAAAGMPRTIDGIRREHLEAFMSDLLTRVRPATASNRYRALQQFFKWAEGIEEIRESPMRKMRPPHVPEEPPPVVREAEARTLLDACRGTGFEERRDAALLRMLFDTGMRRAELAGLAVDDLDLNSRLAIVTGKGRRPRAVPYGVKTARALDLYLLARARRGDADLRVLWLGKKGPLGPTGIAQVLKRRARQAGLAHINPHRFRHTFAHLWKAGGGNEDDLMQLMGWKSRQMLTRYGASAAAERAREAYRRLSPGDRL